MWVRTTEHVPVRCGGLAPRDGERGFEVRRVAERSPSARCSGATSAGAGPIPLCRGLARAGLSIRRGFAVRQRGAATPASGWRARFEIERESTSTDPGAARLPRAAGPRAHAEPHADRAPEYDLSESSAHGGSLFLEVRGPDHLGFLGAHPRAALVPLARAGGDAHRDPRGRRPRPVLAAHPGRRHPAAARAQAARRGARRAAAPLGAAPPRAQDGQPESFGAIVETRFTSRSQRPDCEPPSFIADQRALQRRLVGARLHLDLGVERRRR